MAELNVYQEGAITFASASSSGDSFNNSAKRKVLVKNDSSSSVDVTIVAQEPCNLGELHDEVVSISAGATQVLPELPAKFYTDEEGLTHLEYSSSTDVLVAVIDA